MSIGLSIYVSLLSLGLLCSFIVERSQLKEIPPENLEEIKELLLANKKIEAYARIRQITKWWPKRTHEFIKSLE